MKFHTKTFSAGRRYLRPVTDSVRILHSLIKNRTFCSPGFPAGPQNLSPPAIWLFSMLLLLRRKNFLLARSGILY